MSRSFSILLIVLVTSFMLSFNSYSNNESAENMNDESVSETVDNKENNPDTTPENEPQPEEMKADMKPQEAVEVKPEEVESDNNDMNSEMADDEPVVAEEMVAEEEPEPVEDVLGTVINIAENAIIVKNERDNRDYTLFSESTELLQNIEPGYRVEVFYSGNTITDLTVLGTPVEAKPTILKIK